ncbi:maleylpyruvate isomerase family mycothiol-dependent enzyme [Actinomadura harenae]|uniref:Maleylpyruvate isomerase family mycothiol-dependent enzyme n=2 Tax=Actinomadura harenae TaxID=2483351 RepID=A0A3M2LUD0_9ACTN|nr:maleylpyruvate isomerase family mycothiol-dependent enzyme [Actinomadura harenae]
MLLDRIRLPFEDELRAERFRLIETLDGLSDADFDTGTTLCAAWAPRDVLGHVIGLDYFVASYLPFGSKINDANGAQADRARSMSRERLMRWARHWADNPSTTSRLGAPILLGDLGVHHQDVVRGLGLTRNVPDGTATAIFREGLQLSMWLNRRVLRHRLEPTDGHRPVVLPGARNGPAVRGTREALGMWLCGRDSVAGELEFA